jgi:hypothetical protein
MARLNRRRIVGYQNFLVGENAGKNSNAQGSLCWKPKSRPFPEIFRQYMRPRRRASITTVTLTDLKRRSEWEPLAQDVVRSAPAPLLLPALKAVSHRLPGAKVLGKLSPGTSGLHDEQDPADDAVMILCRTPRASPPLAFFSPQSSPACAVHTDRHEPEGQCDVPVPGTPRPHFILV